MEPAGTYLVNTSDLSEAATILGSFYSRMRISQASAITRPWIRIWRTRVGPLTLDDVDINSAIQYELDAPSGALLCRIRAGEIDFSTGEDIKSFGRGDLVAILADGTPMTGVMRNARCDLVSINRRLLNELAAHRGDRRFDSPFNRFTAPISSSAGQQVADVIDHIRRFVANNSEAAREPLVAGNAARYLAATVLTAFPSQAFTG